MNRLHRGTPDSAAASLGWMTAIVSRLERAFLPTASRSGHGPVAPAPLCKPFPGGPRILVVDDNPSNLGDACALLGSWGIAPTLAANGAEAVALACGGDFDLILMDLQMPVLDGLEATKQIRVYEHEQSCVRAPVLAYTSYVLEDDVLRDCGVDGVLEKPCNAKALHDCLLRWCGPRSGSHLETGALAGTRSPR